MAYRMSAFRRKAGMSQSAFKDYWRNTHAPIALRIPALRSYEQNCVENAQVKGSSAIDGIDGVCKLEFESESAMWAVTSSSITSELKADEEKFLEDLRTFVIEPIAQVENLRRRGHKIMCFATRPSDKDESSFYESWTTGFAAALRPFDGLGGHTQNRVIARTESRQPVGYADVPIDFVDEIWCSEDTELSAFVRAVEDLAADWTKSALVLSVSVNVPTIPSSVQRASHAGG